MTTISIDYKHVWELCVDSPALSWWHCQRCNARRYQSGAEPDPKPDDANCSGPPDDVKDITHLQVRVKEPLATSIRRRAEFNRLSLNQYIKVLMVQDAGQLPVDFWRRPDDERAKFLRGL